MDNAARHLQRHAAAVETMAMPKLPRLIEAVTYPDGRVGFPSVVQYRLESGEILDLPPTKASHPDLARHRKEGPLGSARFDLVIHHNDAYEALARSGQLYCDAHAGGCATVTDNRRTT